MRIGFQFHLQDRGDREGATEVLKPVLSIQPKTRDGHVNGKHLLFRLPSDRFFRFDEEDGSGAQFQESHPVHPAIEIKNQGTALHRESVQGFQIRGLSVDQRESIAGKRAWQYPVGPQREDAKDLVCGFFIAPGQHEVGFSGGT